jgi:hypothetical protein
MLLDFNNILINIIALNDASLHQDIMENISCHPFPKLKIKIQVTKLLKRE